MVAYGGRASTKSWHAVRAALIRGTLEKKLILCVREIQNSISESVHRLMSDQVKQLGLSHFYDVQATTIKGKNGTEIIYKGIGTNPSSVKSYEGVDICLIEEAHSISKESWKHLEPTIRKDGSQFIVVFNPDQETDPTSQKFIFNPPDDAVVTKVNFPDNPWFTEALRKLMEHAKKTDYDAYLHVWEGEHLKYSDAQIFAKKYVSEAFEAGDDWEGPYFGIDFGFSTDPGALTKSWVHNSRLYIEYEAFGYGTEIDKLAELYDTVPGAKEHVSRADSSRPETISYLNNHEYTKVTGVEKWSGSVKDGIDFIKSFEMVVIHPRCENMLGEAKFYSYKTDPQTNEVLPIIIDKHNHGWDSVRYGLNPLIRQQAGVQFMEPDEIKKAIAREVSVPVHTPKVMAVAIAKHMGDENVIARREGRRLHELMKLDGLDAQRTLHWIARAITDYRPDVVMVDGTSIYGAAIVDGLFALHYDFLDVQGNDDPDPEHKDRLYDKTAQMWWEMRRWLKSGDIPADQTLSLDLSAVTYKHSTKRQLVQIETDPELRRRGLAAPNRAHALSLTFAFPAAAMMNANSRSCEPEATASY